MPVKDFENISEKELIKGSLKGVRECQKILFLKFAPRMFTVCRRFARTTMEAEDLLQDGFVIVFTKLQQFKFKGSLEGWIRRIMVHNAIRSVSRKSYKHELYGLDGYDWLGSTDIVAGISAEEILGYIRELPEGYRLVFNLYIMEGYSHKEIAKILDIQESSSRSQLVKARRYLQKKITKANKIAI